MPAPLITYKKVSDLIFDPQNPRLPNSVDGSKEEEVIQWMLENENVIELMASIAEKGFFAAEPLLVSVSKESNSKFEVIEGNRRLTAVKLLLYPELASTRKNAISEIIEEGKKIDTIKELPVIIFDNPDEIQLYLGYRHITGVQPWDSLAKARYLKKIRASLGIADLDELYKSLAKMIGSRSDHVKLLLTGLNIYETIEENSFFGIKDLDEKSIKFGVLYTAVNNNNISYFIGVDLDKENPTENIVLDNLKELSTWMFEKNSEGFTRLGESRNLRLLNKVVENPRALDAFRKEKSLRDAVLLTDEPQEIFKTSVLGALNNLQTARDYMHLIDDPETSDEEILLEITKLSRTISATLKAKALDDTDN
jgi:hypothetical protein